MSGASTQSEPQIHARVRELMAQMTREEKVAQLQSRWGYEVVERGASDAMEDMEFSEPRCRELLGRGIGHISENPGATNRGVRRSAELANDIQRFLVEHTRLGIPAIIHDECLSGVQARGATQFPMSIGVASTFDPALVGSMTQAIRKEMRAFGCLQGLAPVLDITRDPRWGRCEETFGEDVYLASRMGVAYVRGLQGELADGVIATSKHFLGYGMAEGGLNWGSVEIGPRELREHVARSFEAAITEGGLASVMNGYSDIDGLPIISKPILTGLLREQLGFDGYTVSDYTAVERLIDWHVVAGDKRQAAKRALEAGLDVELPSVVCYGVALMDALEEGMVEESTLDAAVQRVLKAKMQLGLFENPYVDPDEAERTVHCDEHRHLARHLAQKSLVLLKNQAQLLPLDPHLDSIAIIGPNANNLRHHFGSFHYPAGLELKQQIDAVVAEAGAELGGPPATGGAFALNGMTVLDAVRATVSASTVVNYATGCGVFDGSTDGFEEAVEAAARSNVAIIVAGESSGYVAGHPNGEFHDRAEIRLPGMQEELVRAVAATGTPVVLAIVTGRPPALTAIVDDVQAILMAWLPGEEGGPAIADALFGIVNPGGKLPISIPRSVGQIPVYYNHKSGGGKSFPYRDYFDLPATPLYPFGFGLSYTQFELQNLTVEPRSAVLGDVVTISIDVENVGQREGDEVVQLYVRDVLASVARPVKQLLGFQRVTLASKERRTVEFRLAVAELAFFDENMEYVVEPGTFQITVGTSSEDPTASDTLEVNGDRAEVANKVFFTQSSVR